MSFAAQNIFTKLGRAMVRPLFQQQYDALPGGTLRPTLSLALSWWDAVLAGGVGQERCVVRGNSGGFVLRCFGQARPHCSGALRGWQVHVCASSRMCASPHVLLVHRVKYTVWDPSPELVAMFATRRGMQIMGLELLAIVLGLSTFLAECRGRVVRVWTDHAGGEGAVRKGSSFSDDHNAIVHMTWLLAANNNIGLFINRVPTLDNIADCPSRDDTCILDALSAVRCEPWLPVELWKPTTWLNVVRYW